MATRTKKKKAASKNEDTITFKKSELLDKLKDFLENEGACEGNWLNKVRVEFLGEKEECFNVKLQFETTLQLVMASACGLPTKEEVAKKILEDLNEGNLDIDIDYSDFEVLNVTRSGEW